MNSPRLTLTLLHRVQWLITKAERLAVDYWDCEYAWDAGQIASALYRLREPFNRDEFRIAIEEDIAAVDTLYYELHAVERFLIKEKPGL